MVLSVLSNSNSTDAATLGQLQGLNSNFGSLIKSYQNTAVTSNTFVSSVNSVIASINSISSNTVTLTANLSSVSANLVTISSNLTTIATDMTNIAANTNNINANLSTISTTLITMKNIWANTQPVIVPSSFTMAAANTTTVSNPNVLANSYIFITATNQAAANLFPLYITAGVGSFTAKTGNNMVAAGTEVFNYLIVN